MPADEDLTACEKIADPVQRALRAGELMAEHQATVAALAQVRRGALIELVEAGWSRGQIAEALDLAQPRISQLLTATVDGERPERGLLAPSPGPVTVAVGAKWEANKPTPGQPSAVVSREAFGAYEHIAEAARRLDVEVAYEVVPPPGLVSLTRPNLVVLTSPRLLPVVGQPLESDPHYGFASDAQGWYLIDRDAGVSHRSPSERGEPIDYAYLGRLPRPDRRGSFIYVAGIHARGTLGAARYLADRVGELWRQVKGRRFSVLLAVHYDPSTGEISDVSPLAPLR